MSDPKDTPTHTPTPMPPPYTAEGRSIRADGGRKLVTIARIVPGVLAKEHEAPTVEMIVRAVNAHEALVGALEDIVSAVTASQHHLDDDPRIVAARAALRAARGEK